MNEDLTSLTNGNLKFEDGCFFLKASSKTNGGKLGLIFILLFSFFLIVVGCIGTYFLFVINENESLFLSLSIIGTILFGLYLLIETICKTTICLNKKSITKTIYNFKLSNKKFDVIENVEMTKLKLNRVIPVGYLISITINTSSIRLVIINDKKKAQTAFQLITELLQNN